jgi:hypothetical protein
MPQVTHHPVCAVVNSTDWFAVCAASIMSVPLWPSAPATKFVERGRRASKALRSCASLVCGFRRRTVRESKRKCATCVRNDVDGPYLDSDFSPYRTLATTDAR